MNKEKRKFVNKNSETMTLIADSGSTKTAWCMAGHPQQVIHTQGLNPYQQTEADICHVIRDELLPALQQQAAAAAPSCPGGPIPHFLAAIHFYGAGCTPEKAPLMVQALRTTLAPLLAPQATIGVESDMLGAARSVCGNQPGIVAILGTGSNSCLYDGLRLHPGMPALGYILGDEGSGAYLGKRLVGDILKHQLPDDLRQHFLDETHETPATLIQKVYRQPLPNRFLASLSPFCARHRQHPAMHDLLADCFRQFFQRNILPALPLWQRQALPLPQPTTVHFVGSIAHHYQEELAQAARQCGCQVGHVVAAPLAGLARYHLDNG